MAKVLDEEKVCKYSKLNQNQDIYHENKNDYNDESKYSENGSILGVYNSIPNYKTFNDDQKDVTHTESIGNGSVSIITHEQDLGYVSPTNQTFVPEISDDDYVYSENAKIAKIERFCIDNRLKKYIKRFIDDECILEDFLNYSEHELVKYFKNDKRYNMSNQVFDRFTSAIEIERQRRKTNKKNIKNGIPDNEIRVALQANGPGFAVATATGEVTIFEAPMAFQTLSQTMKGVFGSVSIAGMVIPAGVGIGLFLIEVAYLSVCRARRKITKAQYYKALRKSALSNTIVTTCTIAGAGLGSLGGPIGMFIGSIAGLLVGLILGYKVSKNYDKWVEKVNIYILILILGYIY